MKAIRYHRVCRPQPILPARHTTYIWQVARSLSSEPQPQKEQQQNVQPQLTRRPRQRHSNPDISQLPEHLQRQWDKERNALWPSSAVTPGSRQKAWWRCDCCPAGQQHTWQATVSDRVRETGTSCCPFKSSHRVCKHCNSLEAKIPMVAEEWDRECNPAATTPQTVAAHSGKKAHWICGSCGHKWRAVIANRTYLGRGCPVCNTGGGGHGATPDKHPCLKVFARQRGLTHIIEEWDTERNREEGWMLDNTQPMSHRIVHWVNYKNCFIGQPHRWRTRVANRVILGHNDPIQAGQVACVCNSLASLYPGVAAQLHPTKNGSITADQIVAGSFKMYWWMNDKKQVWQQSPWSRTQHLASGSLHASVPNKRTIPPLQPK